MPKNQYIDIMERGMKIQSLKSQYIKVMNNAIKLQELRKQYIDMMLSGMQKQELKNQYIELMLKAMQNPELKEQYMSMLNEMENQKQSLFSDKVKSIKEQIEECQSKLFNLFLMDKLQGEAN